MKGKFCYQYGNVGASYINDDETYTYTINGREYKFTVDDMYGQCGASVLHRFTFQKVPIKEETYSDGEAFAKDIRELEWSAGAKLLASAVLNSPLYNFLNNEYWQKGTARVNANSGNTIVIFELDKRSK